MKRRLHNSNDDDAGEVVFIYDDDDDYDGENANYDNEAMILSIILVVVRTVFR